MSVLNLTVESRDPARSSAKDVRREGNIPAVVYGRGKDSVSLQMDYQTFRKLFREAGESTLIELNIDGKKKETVLVHDYQLNPVTDEFVHVDFLAVKMDEEITTHVPIEIVGVAPAVKDLGGMLSTPREEVEVRCLPKYIPHSFQLDISVIADFHTTLHVSDLVVPSGVEILTEAEITLATVSAPQEEKEEESVVPVTEGDQVEVGGQGAPDQSDGPKAE